MDDPDSVRLLSPGWSLKYVEALVTLDNTELPSRSIDKESLS